MASATTLITMPLERARDVVSAQRIRTPDSIRQAAERLIGCYPGILLIGSSVQTSTAVGDLLAHARAAPGNRIQPVRFPAATGTPALLRDVVERAYKARTDTATRLLIVVAQADALSADTLQELEVAAEAALAHGGLQFLFTSTEDLSSLWTRDAFVSLSASLEDPLRLVAGPEEPGLLATYGSLDAPEEPDPWPAETSRHGFRARTLVLILAVLALMALVAIGVGYQRHLPLLGLLPSAFMPAPSAPVSHLADRPIPAPGVPPHMAQMLADHPPAARMASAPQPATAPPVRRSVPVPQPAIRLSVQAPGAPFAAAPLASIPTTEIAPAAVVPGASLLLIAEPGDTLPKLYAKVYQGMTPPPYSEVTAVNPAQIKPGDHLMFPTPPNGWRP